jgi:hypothetical protein
MNKPLYAGILVLAAVALGTAPGKEGEPRPPQPEPVVPLVGRAVQPEIDRHLADQQELTRKELARGAQVPASFKLPVCAKALSDPWGGTAELEKHGLGLAAAARKGLAGLPALIDGLGAMLGKPAGEGTPVPRGKLTTLEEHAHYLEAVLDRARELRDSAVRKLSAQERKFAFSRPPDMLTELGPQLPFEAGTRERLQKDKDFCALIHERVDWAQLAGAAKVLAALADPDYLASLQKALQAAAPIKETVPGVTGDLLYKKETRHGLILFGGKGANTYDLKEPAALIVDLGGDDHYKGLVASSADADHPNSVVIDLAGKDTYEGTEFGVATGRLGVGLLIDLEGNDTYKLATGSGGTGFGGIGILCDAAGDDVYTGSQFTQGAAVAGLGLLLDLAGDDRHTSFGFAVGFGGPLGAGAVIDVAGNDSYQCGNKFPSGYNASENPTAKPGDPAFQYDCFGLGTGMGRRIFPFNREADPFALAGGVGVVIDLVGNDRYDSSNFSQACGYFFGAGLKLDLDGDDVHAAARYGLAAGAHYGVGLHVDYAGKDVYTSTGPVYTGGCAWDHSVFLCIDAGDGDDTYNLERTTGLGLADIGSWAVFADLGGKDVYRTSGLGRVSDKGLAVFYDAAGVDDYRALKDPNRDNGKTYKDPSGGLFVDK